MNKTPLWINTNFHNAFLNLGTSGLFLKLKYCESCCNKHGCESGYIISWSKFPPGYAQE
jgi:hypothetical protein